ncbi:MAG TPA: twin-arginine translocation signal domain-containing protein, partial [Candidatus Dormibacteraeota bacterium]|nr:twin-arginine translocation signal domain-containing protein [Candidatus Dormibacteraeota bacterium]
MKRRDFLERLGQGAALAGLAGGASPAWGAEPAASANTTGRSPLKITGVRAILTAPARIRLCVV